MLARSQFYVAGRREKTRLGAWSRSSGNMELCCPLAPAAYQVSRCVGLDVEALPLGIPPVGDGVRTQSRYDLAKDLFHPRQAGESKLAEILLFHHAQGRTQGVIAFADELRSAGHSVHTPDLFDGRIFEDIETGMRFVRELGFAEVLERGEKAAQRLPTDLVYAGFSLGVVPAQKLTQTRPGSRGHFSSIPACQSQSSARHGPRACPCRSMAWMVTLSLSMRAISTRLELFSKRPKMPRCSCILASSTCLPTARFRHTMRRQHNS